MPFDYKKEYKNFYMPPRQPMIVEIPKINYISVKGAGNPNEEGGEYKTAIRLLYGVAFTIKTSHKCDYKINGYFEYTVPPPEGLWWQDEATTVDYSHKDDFHWISLIRLPDFVSIKDFKWAIGEATRKKKLDFSKVEFLTYDEGLCVQCMHIGPYDNEPETVKLMEGLALESGYKIDITCKRLHHEIYLRTHAKRMQINSEQL